MSYDCLASWPGLSPEEHRKIRDKLAREAEFYYQAMTEIKGGQNYGNQRTLGASALGLCALVLTDYRGSAHTPQQWLDMALWAIKCPDNFWFWRPAGMFVEGYDYLFQLHSPITLGKAQATIGERSVVWPGFDFSRHEVNPTTLNTFFAGPVKVTQIPSHWRPDDSTPTDNVAIGAKWQGENGTALLSALYAQQPTQPKVIAASEDDPEFLRLEAHTDNWVIRAQARPHVGPLTEGEAVATAHLLVTCREVTSGKVGGVKWIYVWGAEELELPFLKAGAVKDFHRGLLLWDGKAWQIPATAEGT